MVEQENGYKKRIARTLGTVLETRLVVLVPLGPSPKEIQAPILQALDGKTVIPVGDSPKGPGSHERTPVSHRGKGR